MIGTVLVPLDGSELAEKALPYAQMIAEHGAAPLHLVRVVPSNSPVSTAEEARTYLRKVLQTLSDRVQISVRAGAPADQIIDAAQEMIDPIIVMTTHGRSGIGRWFYGSVADKVVRGAEVPVLLIRAGMEPKPEKMVSSILVSLDGSVASEAALPYAERLARVFDAELHLVRVAETTQLYAMLTPEAQTPAAAQTLNELVARLVSESTTYLNRVAEDLRAKGLRVTVQTLEGFPAEQLLAYEREVGTDLTVMATHGRTGLSRLVFGSVAERILKQGNTPVMMIRPKDGELAAKDD